jgi:hypothetical protein
LLLQRISSLVSFDDGDYLLTREVGADLHGQRSIGAPSAISNRKI